MGEGDAELDEVSVGSPTLSVFETLEAELDGALQGSVLLVSPPRQMPRRQSSEELEGEGDGVGSAVDAGADVLPFARVEGGDTA